MHHESKLELLDRSKKSVYRNYLYFVSTGDPSLNAERVKQRLTEGGHPVYLEKIAKRYERSMAQPPQAIRLSDRSYLFDNRGAESRLAASVLGGSELRLESDRVPEWVGRQLM